MGMLFMSYSVVCALISVEKKACSELYIEVKCNQTFFFLFFRNITLEMVWRIRESRGRLIRECSNSIDERPQESTQGSGSGGEEERPYAGIVD